MSVPLHTTTFEPVPAGYEAGDTVGWLLTGAIMVLAGGALIWALRRWVRDHDAIPTMMWVGALCAVAAEPILDLLCHIWYAPDLPLTIVKGWGIQVPLLVGLAWAFFVGMTGYKAYLLMCEGMTTRAVFSLMGVYMLLDVALEYPAIAGDAWKYYSDQPFELLGFPLWMTWINATGMILGGFLLWVLAPHVTGAWRLVIMLVPGAGYLTAWTVLGWPNYLALEWDPPVVLKWSLSLVSLGFCLIVVRGIAACVAPGSPAQAFASPARRTEAQQSAPVVQ